MRRVFYLLPLLVMVAACGDKSADPDPTNPGSAKVLFVHGITGLDSLEFQGRPLGGPNITTFAQPGPIDFSGITRYMGISAIATDLHAVEPDSNLSVLTRRLEPAVDSAYSLYGYRNRSGEIDNLLLRDDFATDSAKRQLVRTLNLIADLDSLQFRFIGPDSAIIETPVSPFASPPLDFSPLFDSISTSITLQVDIVDEDLPGGIDNLFTGELTLRSGRIFTFVAIGTPGAAQIVVIPHLDL